MFSAKISLYCHLSSTQYTVTQLAILLPRGSVKTRPY